MRCGTSQVPESKIPFQKPLMALTFGLNTRVVVPVVFHVVGNSTVQAAVSEPRIRAQMKQLNRDFSMTSPDSGGVPTPFVPWKQQEARIVFKLVRIVRKTSATNFESFSQVLNDPIKLSSQGGSDAVDTSKNLNVWVGDVDPYLGYATFPWWPSLFPGEGYEAMDGVVIHYGTVGNTFFPSVSFVGEYDLGKTLTHEVGHYFGMRHMWYNHVNDTEGAFDDTSSCSRSLPVHAAQKGASSGKPSFPRNPNVCSSVAGAPAAQHGNMYMDYMDYSDDSSLIMFTQAQIDEAMQMISAYRPSMVKEFSKIATSTLNLSGLSPSNSADYYQCVMTSGGTSVTSNAVRVRYDGQGNRLEPEGEPMEWSY